MGLLILGLVLFLGLHSVRIVADDWRSRQRLRWGDSTWKAWYSLVSLIGLGLVIWGYGLARQAPLGLWEPPMWTRHLAALLTWPAFVLLAASQIPGNALKARWHHPLLLGTKLWALAHLLANGHLADLLLFGGFLGWSIADFRSARRREVASPSQPVSAWRTGLVIGVGSLAWAGFAFWAHAAWIGVRPFGGT